MGEDIVCSTVKAVAGVCAHRVTESATVERHRNDLTGQ